MYLIVRFFYIRICIIHILSCFVHLVCRAFLTWASGSEDVQTLPTSSTLNKSFYSINLVVAERNCLYVLDWRVDECFFFLSLRASRGILQILQSDWFRHSLWTAMSFLVFPPAIDFWFPSESRPVLKWYYLLYLDFSLHNNWPLFFSFIRRPRQ